MARETASKTVSGNPLSPRSSSLAQGQTCKHWQAGRGKEGQTFIQKNSQPQAKGGNKFNPLHFPYFHFSPPLPTVLFTFAFIDTPQSFTIQTPKLLNHDGIPSYR